MTLNFPRLSSSGRDPDSDVVSETTAEDRVKISAIDWLLYDPQQRSEALRQANALMRTFLVSRKIGATRVLFNKVTIPLKLFHFKYIYNDGWERFTKIEWIIVGAKVKTEHMNIFQSFL